MSLARSIGHSMASHGSLKFLSFNYKNSRFLEFEIKRNSIKDTRSKSIVFARFYFGEKSAALKAVKGRDCRPSPEGFRTKWKKKIRLRNI